MGTAAQRLGLRSRSPWSTGKARRKRVIGPRFMPLVTTLKPARKSGRSRRTVQNVVHQISQFCTAQGAAAEASGAAPIGGYRSSSVVQRKLQLVTREQCLLPPDRRILAILSALDWALGCAQISQLRRSSSASRAVDYESGEPPGLCNAVCLRKRSAEDPGHRRFARIFSVSAMQSRDDGSVCALSAFRRRRSV